MNVRDFLSLSQPLRVEVNDHQLLLVAFVIADDGELQAMTLPLGGGTVRFERIEDVDFPPAVASGPVIASGSETLQ